MCLHCHYSCELSFLFPRVTRVQKPGVITYSCTVWSDDVTLCLLWLTAFCIFSFYFYQTDHSYEVEVSIPLSSIFDIKKFSKKNLPKDKQMFLLDGFEIFCSNIQSHRVSALYSSCNSLGKMILAALTMCLVSSHWRAPGCSGGGWGFQP